VYRRSTPSGSRCPGSARACGRPRISTGTRPAGSACGSHGGGACGRQVADGARGAAARGARRARGRPAGAAPGVHQLHDARASGRRVRAHRRRPGRAARHRRRAHHLSRRGREDAHLPVAVLLRGWVSYGGVNIIMIAILVCGAVHAERQRTHRCRPGERALLLTSVDPAGASGAGAGAAAAAVALAALKDAVQAAGRAPRGRAAPRTGAGRAPRARKGPAPRGPAVVVLDEMDQLLAGDQAVLTELFLLPKVALRPPSGSPSCRTAAALEREPHVLPTRSTLVCPNVPPTGSTPMCPNVPTKRSALKCCNMLPTRSIMVLRTKSTLKVCSMGAPSCAPCAAHKEHLRVPRVLPSRRHKQHSSRVAGRALSTRAPAASSLQQPGCRAIRG